MFVFVIQGLASHHVFQRTYNQGERCAQFVRDVCKEAQTLVVQVLFLFMVPFLRFVQVLQINAPFVSLQQDKEQGQSGKGVYQFGYP